MRLLVITLFSWLSLLGQTESSKIVFSNIQELKHWADANSWGGCRVDVVNHSGAEAVIVRRSHTSGIQSCSLSVFVKGKGGLIEALMLRGYHGYWIEFKQQGDSITLESFDQFNNKTFEILRFSIASLGLQSFEK